MEYYNNPKASSSGMRRQRVVQPQSPSKLKNGTLEYSYTDLNTGNDWRQTDSQHIKPVYYNPWDEGRPAFGKPTSISQQEIFRRQPQPSPKPTRVSKAQSGYYRVSQAGEAVEVIPYNILYAPVRVRQLEMARVYSPKDLVAIRPFSVHRAKNSIAEAANVEFVKPKAATTAQSGYYRVSQPGEAVEVIPYNILYAPVRVRQLEIARVYSPKDLEAITPFSAHRAKKSIAEAANVEFVKPKAATTYQAQTGLYGMVDKREMVRDIPYRILYSPLRMQQAERCRVYTPHDVPQLESETIHKARRYVYQKDVQYAMPQSSPKRKVYLCQAPSVDSLPELSQATKPDILKPCKNCRNMPVIKVVPPATQATLIKRPRTASPDIGPSGAPNYEQLRMRRHRSYTSEETLADADIKSVGAVVMGRACTLRDQIDAATDVIQQGDGRLYGGRARSRSKERDDYVDPAQRRRSIEQNERSKARSRERNDQSSCANKGGPKKDSASLTQFDNKDVWREPQMQNRPITENDAENKGICVCYCQQYDDTSTLLSIERGTSVRKTTKMKGGKKCSHKTKVKQTQVPNQRAHLGIQLHGGSQGEDIIERSQWSLNESPRCYKNGNFSPNVEAMKKNVIVPPLDLNRTTNHRNPCQHAAEIKARSTGGRSKCSKAKTTSEFVCRSLDEGEKRAIAGCNDRRANMFVCQKIRSQDRCGREPISEMETICKSMCNIKIAHECRRTCKQGFDVTQRSQSISDCAERADFTAQCEDLSDAKITEIPEDSVLSLAEIESRDAANQHSAVEYKEVTTSTENIMVTAGLCQQVPVPYYHPYNAVPMMQWYGVNRSVFVPPVNVYPMSVQYAAAQYRMSLAQQFTNQRQISVHLSLNSKPHSYDSTA